MKDSLDKMECPLCGNEFDASAVTCHEGCPLHKNCDLVACPKCHYEFPAERSWLVRSLSKLFNRG